MQKRDIEELKAYLIQNKLPKRFSSTASNFKKRASKFEIINGELRKCGLKIVEYKDRKLIFDHFHQVT